MCKVCGGTGWMEYPHPNEEGEPFPVIALRPCEGCIADEICPACGQGMMIWGAILICVHCGFSFDEAAQPADALL